MHNLALVSMLIAYIYTEPAERRAAALAYSTQVCAYSRAIEISMRQNARFVKEDREDLTDLKAGRDKARALLREEKLGALPCSDRRTWRLLFCINVTDTDIGIDVRRYERGVDYDQICGEEPYLSATGLLRFPPR